MYTWRDLWAELKDDRAFDMSLEVPRRLLSLMQYVDIIVDGEFKQDECLYKQELGDGMLSSIGSGNQRIWDIKMWKENASCPEYYMRDLVGLYVKPDTNDLVYITKE